MSSVAEAAARNGFALERSEDLAEIKGTAHVLRHQRSGARLLFLRNSDPNKAFSITFKTPAADDTGVFHILEHSVLCGSQRFPIKEPFVNLLKSSMQTFLNAMTFPDKTMYPVSSTNAQDLQNLMEVYLDAVFQPAIYDKRTVFEQEGWHLELAPGSTDELVYNGVVYNEMKGALADPESVLYDALSAALFPDTTYRFESGGTPAAIPTLTYESYLDSHRRHYRPDNSYITLYGDLDLERFLGFLDREYLAPLAEADRGPLDANPLAMQSAVVARGVRRPMATAPENACCALGFVLGNAAERERMVAADILLDAIAGSNEAPLKRALLDAGLAADVQAFVADSIAQPFAMLELRGIVPGTEGALERFEETVQAEAARLAGGGLDRSLVRAAIAQAEFTMREHSFGYPDGVALAVAALAGWLYDDALATDYLRYEDVFASLRAKVDEGYFEQLLREVFLDSRHWASVELVPVEDEGDAAERARLDALAAGMDAAAFEAVQAEVEVLRAVQEAPDAPADLARLPHLAVADIGDAPVEAPVAQRDDLPLPCLRHEVGTNGIAYATRYFPLDAVAFDELPYVGLLALVLGRLGTARHTAAELDTLVQAHLGTLSFFSEVHEAAGSDRSAFAPKFVASAAALEAEVEHAASLVNEILLETDFTDTAKIADMMLQKRVAMEQAFATAGHSIASQRAASYYLPAAQVRQGLGGVDFYWFLRDALDGFDGKAAAITAKLASLAARLFTDRGCVLSFAGSAESLERYFAAGPCLGMGAGAANAEAAAANAEGADAPAPGGAPALEVPAPVDRREAFAVPTDVSFTALGFDRRLLDPAAPYSGAWLLASRILSYDYLWNEVRVKGGAYGCGFSTTRPGLLTFHSYRDPHIDATVQRFGEAGPWLAALEPTADEMEGYVVSTTAGFDAPLKPRDLIRRQCGMFFSGVTPAMRAQVRCQVVGATVDDVRALGGAIAQAAQRGCRCTVGSAELIEGSGLDWNVVDVLGGAR